VKEGNEWKEYAKYSFGYKTFPDDKNLFEYDITSPEFPYMLRNNFFISKSFLIIDFMKDNKRYFSFYDKNMQSLKSGKIVNDMTGCNMFFPRWISNNILIESINSEFLLNDFHTLIEKESSLSNLKMDDNPILILYSLKVADDGS
jgi:hypothetical protein